jgi:hypothetical protein
MHEIIDKKFYLGPEFGILVNKKWITISELLQGSPAGEGGVRTYSCANGKQCSSK